MINTAVIEKEMVYLYPSSLVVNNQPMLIHTILGSCISVCLYDTKKKYGGMNHYMLPYWNGSGLASPKYGNIAIERLIEGMIGLGCRREDLIAKVFGGAAVLKVSSNSFNVGDKNIAAANDLLSGRNIPIVAQSVGGELGRKIIFNTHSGQVIHRIIKNNNYPDGSVSG